mmetsp:Transcript_104/g.486  ORF Transcript_104/g.486 Transcript_104/m.486 type:complete len:235 (+) Transcript_104:501-1205(+)
MDTKHEWEWGPRPRRGLHDADPGAAGEHGCGCESCERHKLGAWQPRSLPECQAEKTERGGQSSGRCIREEERWRQGPWDGTVGEPGEWGKFIAPVGSPRVFSEPRNAEPRPQHQHAGVERAIFEPSGECCESCCDNSGCFAATRRAHAAAGDPPTSSEKEVVEQSGRVWWCCEEGGEGRPDEWQSLSESGVQRPDSGQHAECQDANRVYERRRGEVGASAERSSCHAESCDSGK